MDDNQNNIEINKGRKLKPDTVNNSENGDEHSGTVEDPRSSNAEKEPRVNKSINHETNQRSGRKSIRSIKLDGRKKASSKAKPAFADERKYASRRYKSPNRKKAGWIIAGILGTIAIILAIGAFAHSATVEIETRSYTINPLTIELDEENADLLEVKSVQTTESETINSSDQEQVSLPAEGMVTVLNTTDEVQTFVATTRFEAPNGLEYRTPTSITIPAATGSGSGRLEGVRVVADIAGPQGNQEVSQDLSVPGLVGTELEGLVYAQAESPFTGGFEGVRAVASDTEIADAQEDLQNVLSDSMILAAEEQLQDNRILLAQTGDTEFANLGLGGDESSVEVTVQASANFVTISETDLIRLMTEAAQINIPNISALNITNLDQLAVTYNSETDPSEIQISGQANLAVIFDEAEIKSDIAGLSTREMSQTLEGQPGILSVDAQVSPFWRSSIPENIDQIQLEFNDRSGSDAQELRTEPSELEPVVEVDGGTEIDEDNIESEDQDVSTEQEEDVVGEGDDEVGETFETDL